MCNAVQHSLYRHTLPFLAEDKAVPVTVALATIGREVMEDYLYKDRGEENYRLSMGYHCMKALAAHTDWPEGAAMAREMMEKIENPEPPGLISSPVYGLCDDTVETFKKLSEGYQSFLEQEKKREELVSMAENLHNNGGSSSVIIDGDKVEIDGIKLDRRQWQLLHNSPGLSQNHQVPARNRGRQSWPELHRTPAFTGSDSYSQLKLRSGPMGKDCMRGKSAWENVIRCNVPEFLLWWFSYAIIGARRNKHIPGPAG